MKTYTAKKLFNYSGTAADEVRAELGEGPTWNANGVGGHRRTLSWVDIKKGKLFLWDTVSNRISVIYIVHLDEDQLHYLINLSGGGMLGGGGTSSGSGSSVTTNGLSEPFLVEGKPTIQGETELLGFAVPVADSEVFLCGSQHGLFYLRTNKISRMSLSVHDDKNALSLTPSFSTAAKSGQTNLPQLSQLMDTTALKYSANHSAQSTATIRFFTFYVTMEQYIYALAPVVTKLPKFEPFKEMQLSGDKNGNCPAATNPSAKCTDVATHRHQHTSVAATPHTHRIRFNDAKTDRSGRLFLGTMDMEEKEPIGDLYVLDVIDGDKKLDASHNVYNASDNTANSTRSGTDNSIGKAAEVHRPSAPLRSLSHTLAGQQPTISNGIDWSPCNTRMYYVDSPTRRIDVFDYRIFKTSKSNTSEIDLDNKNRGLSFGMDNRAVLIDLNKTRVLEKTTTSDKKGTTINSTPASSKVMNIKGFPDGLTVDAHGNVWLALWDGGRVVGIDPTTQTVFAEVVVPNVSFVTSVCFGGPALSWLIITTATKEGEPDSGHIFVAEHVGSALGLPATEFKGNAFSPPAMSFAVPKSAAPVAIMSARL